MEICQLYISPGHNFFGHHGREPDENAAIEVTSVECIAGRGLRGDRFFDYKENYKGPDHLLCARGIRRASRYAPIAELLSGLAATERNHARLIAVEQRARPRTD